VVPIVDLAAGQIQVDPLPGLLEPVEENKEVVDGDS